MCGSRVREVDNSFYDTLGDAWYGDDAHAIAVLRAESAVRVDFVRARLRREDVLAPARAFSRFPCRSIARVLWPWTAVRLRFAYCAHTTRRGVWR